MALPEIIHKKAEYVFTAFCNKRVPAHVRDKLRLSFEFDAQVVTLFEDRPHYNDPAKWTHSQIAQFRFDSKSLKWSLYCRDRYAKWHAYQGIEAGALDDLVAEVDRDPTGIFWG